MISSTPAGLATLALLLSGAIAAPVGPSGSGGFRASHPNFQFNHGSYPGPEHHGRPAPGGPSFGQPRSLDHHGRPDEPGDWDGRHSGPAMHDFPFGNSEFPGPERHGGLVGPRNLPELPDDHHKHGDWDGRHSGYDEHGRPGLAFAHGGFPGSEHHGGPVHSRNLGPETHHGSPGPASFVAHGGSGFAAHGGVPAGPASHGRPGPGGFGGPDGPPFGNEHYPRNVDHDQDHDHDHDHDDDEGHGADWTGPRPGPPGYQGGRGGPPFANGDFPGRGGPPFAKGNFPGPGGPPFAKGNFPGRGGPPLANGVHPGPGGPPFANGAHPGPGGPPFTAGDHRDPQHHGGPPFNDEHPHPPRDVEASEAIYHATAPETDDSDGKAVSAVNMNTKSAQPSGSGGQTLADGITTTIFGALPFGLIFGGGKGIKDGVNSIVAGAQQIDKR